MTITTDPNYLAHYGVPGMKWGVRKNFSRGKGSGGSSKFKKFVKKRMQKHIDKRKEKNEKIKKTVDNYGAFGVAGVAASRYLGYSSTHALRSTLATIINTSANAYITTSSNYRIARGADFVRRASISYLSIRDSVDKINAFADVGRAAIYYNQKKRSG